MPNARGSAIDDAPARPTTRSAAASTAPISSRRYARGRYRARMSSGRRSAWASARAKCDSPVTCKRYALFKSRASAPNTASLTVSEPWLPPVTTTRAASAGTSIARRAASRVQRKSDGNCSCHCSICATSVRNGVASAVPSTHNRPVNARRATLHAATASCSRRETIVQSTFG